MSQAEFPAGGMKVMMKPRGFFFSPPLFSPAFFLFHLNSLTG